ncbi:rhamnulokinase [Arachnia propionica]|uniref:Rhamnulokinase n=1 Tax=Arachnia propionica TaxID=1750 RepID=A0A3P1T3T4_9ACTN|nr:FGGY-family carbohydrate kinase [Arachnia propionica]MDO5082405.1 FGGY family carbohydrate kinase [Arachnia propionica]RRD04019.1 rhamnulokinase [Arachnia propionica]
MPATALAVDLGSSSGRIIAGVLEDGRVTETEVHRFPHTATKEAGYLCWDLVAMWSEVVRGLQLAIERFPDATTVSVDTWGVDWVPLDADGNPLTPARCYRDERTGRTLEAYRERLPESRQWELTGIAPATINSSNQLFAFLTEEAHVAAETDQILFLPDWFTYMLTGVRGWSRSIASTSGLCAPGAQAWSEEVFEALGIPRSWVGELTHECSVVGPCSVDGLEQLTVVRAGAHDSACAVAALQRDDAPTCFLSAGSWSVLGVLRDEPLMGDDARALGLTNEARAEGGVRPLFNITGLWILQECQRDWQDKGLESDIVALLEEAAAAASLGVTIDPDDPQYAHPGSMVERVTAALEEAGAPVGISQGQLVRALCESFAERYARAVHDLSALTGEPLTRLNLVGGGSRNTLLCDLTATALGVPVLAGPAEASTLGSLLVQFEVSGALQPEQRNEVIAATAMTRTHQP